jgi:TolB-like protein/Tfp pilus assembly protein PilF
MPEGEGKTPPKIAEKCPQIEESKFRALLAKLRKRRIIETLAAFIGGGWLLVEVVERLLVGHYHFPEKAIDITVVTLIGGLLCTLIWRWFSGQEKPRKLKLEHFLIPLVLLITVLLDVNLLLHLKDPEPEAIPAAKWKNSIAVLPFDNISPEEGQDYFCDGLTDELITRLSKIKDLKVIAKTSAFSFKGKEIDIRDIGKKLNVATVLEGAVRKAGNKLRITAQLINVANGFHLWSDSYDKELIDVFAIQDEIALTIADKMKLTLLGEEKVKLTTRPTENLQAYNLYLKGRYFWNKRGKDDNLKSIEYFNEAINKDPSYALGYSGMGMAYVTLGSNDFFPSKEVFPKAKAAALKALEIDPSLDEAHVVLGAVLNWYERDFSGSENEFRRVIELNPGNGDAHHWYAWLLLNLGRNKQAIKEMLLARDLDPLAPRKNADVGSIFYYARDYPRAVEELKKSIELFPEHTGNYIRIARVYCQTSQYKEAIESILPYAKQPEFGPILAYAYAISGNKDKAQEILGNILKNLSQQYFSPSYIAEVYIALGDRKQAFFWLEKAFSEFGYNLGRLKVDPEFDPLRSDPRFTELLRKTGLEK